VLFVRSNNRFEILKSKSLLEGLPVPVFCKSAEKPDTVVFGWESQRYEADVSLLMANRPNATVLPEGAPPMASPSLPLSAEFIKGSSPQLHFPSLGCVLDLKVIPALDPASLHLHHRFPEVKLLQKRPSHSGVALVKRKLLDLAFRAKTSIAEVIREAWTRDDDLRAAIPEATLNDLIAGPPNLVVFERRLERLGRTDSQPKRISYWLAEQLWKRVRDEAEFDEKVFETELHQHLCQSAGNTPTLPIQFYVPDLPGLKGFAAFDSESFRRKCVAQHLFLRRLAQGRQGAL
jgi:hypothetical protein